MNQGWQNNSWIFATPILIQGATGILQAYIFSQEQPEEVFFVLALLVASSFFFVISLAILVVSVKSARRARMLEGRVGGAAPGRCDSASSVLPGVGENDRLIRWFLGDWFILVMAILGFLLGILRLSWSVHDVLSYKVSGSIMISSMIIAGLWLGFSVLFFAAYAHRKRRRRSMEAPPRLARTRGQPKEAREE